MLKYSLITAVLALSFVYFFLLPSKKLKADGSQHERASSLFELSATSIQGEVVPLSRYKGSVLLVVNTASKCGFTSQYESLEELYQRYKDKGLVILGFPSNDFMGQEPGSNEQIAKFCKLNYGVTFPLFAKASVRGSDIQPIFSFLTNSPKQDLQGNVRWNFEKFLVSKDGELVERFSSRKKPLSDDIVQAVEQNLTASAGA